METDESKECSSGNAHEMSVDQESSEKIDEQFLEFENFAKFYQVCKKNSLFTLFLKAISYFILKIN